MAPLTNIFGIVCIQIYINQRVDFLSDDFFIFLPDIFHLPSNIFHAEIKISFKMLGKHEILDQLCPFNHYFIVLLYLIVSLSESLKFWDVFIKYFWLVRKFIFSSFTSCVNLCQYITSTDNFCWQLDHVDLVANLREWARDYLVIIFGRTSFTHDNARR